MYVSDVVYVSDVAQNIKQSVLLVIIWSILFSMYV